MNALHSPKGSDQRLLKAGRSILVENGVAGLRLRAVAKRAGVNLGMFPYHFGNKKEFTRQLLQQIYEAFFQNLSLESRGGGSSLDRLRRALRVFGRFARDQRQLFTALLSDVLRGEKSCQSFFRANFPRHIHVIADLIKQGQRAGEIKNTPLPIAVAFALGGMGVPNLAVSLMERVRAPVPAVAGPREWKNVLLSDRAIENRIGLILSALATGRRPSRRR